MSFFKINQTALSHTIKVLSLILITSYSYAGTTPSPADKFTITLNAPTSANFDLESARLASEGHIQVNPQNGRYYLASSVKIVSAQEFVLKGELFIGQWDLVIESPSIRAEKATISSFENLKSSGKSLSSGNVFFISNERNSSPLKVLGEMTCLLIGQEANDLEPKAGNGGSLQSPANAHYRLILKHNLLGGESPLASGGENGNIVFSLIKNNAEKIDNTTAYINTPDGIELIDQSVLAPKYASR